MNHNTPPDPDARLGHHLREQAAALTLADTPVDAIIRRGDRRRQRRRTMIGVVSATALVVTGVVGLNLLSRQAGHRVVGGTTTDNSTNVAVSATPNGTPQTTVLDVPIDSPAITPVASNLTWNVVVPNASEALGYGYLPLGLSGDGPLYAYSSAPGRSVDFTNTLYRSDDGVTWTPTADVSLPDQSVYNPVAAAGNGDRLYALGTAAATAPIPPGGAGDLVIDSSSDGGATWTDTVLDVDLRALDALAGVRSVTAYRLQIAASGNMVIAMAHVEPVFDLTQFDGQGISFGTEGITVTPYTCDGSELGVASTVVGDATQAPVTTSVVYDGSYDDLLNTCVDEPDPSSTGYTWSELGIDQAAVDAYLSPAHAFVSTDGATFSEVPFPGTSPGALNSASLLRSLRDGFGLITTESSVDATTYRQRFFTSSDGVTWQEHELPAELVTWSVSNLGSLTDGTLVLTGYSGDGEATAASSVDGGTTWEVSRLSGLLTDEDGATAYLSTSDATIGTTGVTLVGFVNIDPFVEHGPVSITRDGIVVTQIDSNGSLVFTDEATGDELGRMTRSLEGSTTNDRTSYDIDTGDVELFADDGAALLTMPAADQSELYSQIYQLGTKLVVLHSTDGVSWSREDIDSIVGSEIDMMGLIRTGSSEITLSVTDSINRNPDGTPRTLVLVGTPTG